jgi:hypothetical protein
MHLAWCHGAPGLVLMSSLLGAQSRAAATPPSLAPLSCNPPRFPAVTLHRRVAWCHGASGLVLTLIKAAQTVGDPQGRYMTAAQAAADDIWQRGLLKKVCRGRGWEAPDVRSHLHGLRHSQSRKRCWFLLVSTAKALLLKQFSLSSHTVAHGGTPRSSHQVPPAMSVACCWPCRVWVCATASAATAMRCWPWPATQGSPTSCGRLAALRCTARSTGGSCMMCPTDLRACLR